MELITASVSNSTCSLPRRYENHRNILSENKALILKISLLHIKTKSQQEKLFKKCNRIKKYKSDLQSLASEYSKAEQLLLEKSIHFNRLQDIIKLHRQHIQEDQCTRARLIHQSKKQDKKLQFILGYFKQEIIKLNKLNSKLAVKLIELTFNKKQISYQYNSLFTKPNKMNFQFIPTLANLVGYHTSNQLTAFTSWLQANSTNSNKF